jgi:hypothetical protein
VPDTAYGCDLPLEFSFSLSSAYRKNTTKRNQSFNIKKLLRSAEVIMESSPHLLSFFTYEKVRDQNPIISGGADDGTPVVPCMLKN